MNLIFIVDDQAVNRQIYAKMAAGLGPDIRVETYADATTALENAVQKCPSLIVTDYQMPTMTGAEFVRQLRSNSQLADIPVIVITVYDERDYRLNALDAGATDFLLSPVDHREFVTRARNLLKLRSAQLLLNDRASRLKQELESTELSLQKAVRDSSERMAQVIDSVPALISATDRDGRHLFGNAYYAKMIKRDQDSTGQKLRDFIDEDRAERHDALNRLVLQSGKPIHGFEEELYDPNGSRKIYFTTKSPLRGVTGDPIGVVTSSLDITDRKAAEQHLRHLAHHDLLTNLPNRVSLLDCMQREIARCRRGDRQFALLLIDLDEFKRINDALGHSAGDAFLSTVAQRLRSFEDDGHFVARLGGDEFAILQKEIGSDDQAAQLANAIQRSIGEPIEIRNTSVSSSASIGIAIHPNDGADADELLRHADIAMYEAKADRNGEYRFYAADMNLRACQAIALDAQLRDAITKGEFELHYQPQISLSNSRPIAAEALIRWRRPDGTLAAPNSFLPRAEESGMILAINEWVMLEACKQAAIWRRSGGLGIRISVNLSALQFRRGNLPLVVARILNESGLDSRFLELELTENFLVHDVEEVATQLRQLKELGVVISIDDFGSGYSSLNYVKKLPVDRIKIDQSFIKDLSSNPGDRAIVSAVVNLAHSIDLEVVAEGVETESQLQLVRAIGCDAVQGYYYARPMTAARFSNHLLPPTNLAATG